MYKETKKNYLKNSISINNVEIANGRRIEEDYIISNSKLKLYEAIQKLDANTKEVMYLRLTGDLTFREIGQILHKSENWAKVTFYRGRKKLKKEDIL